MPDPNAVGAGRRPARPGLGGYKFRSICPRQMVSIGVKRRTPVLKFPSIFSLFLCYNEDKNQLLKELLSWKRWTLEGGSRNTAKLPG